MVCRYFIGSSPRLCCFGSRPNPKAERAGLASTASRIGPPSSMPICFRLLHSAHSARARARTNQNLLIARAACLFVIEILRRLLRGRHARVKRNGFSCRSDACTYLCVTVTNFAAHCGEEIALRKIPLVTLGRDAMFEGEYSSRFVSEARRICLLYTSDAADDLLCVDLGGRRIIKKKK